MNKFIMLVAVVLTAVVLVRRQRRRPGEWQDREHALSKSDSVAVSRLEDDGAPMTAPMPD